MCFKKLLSSLGFTEESLTPESRPKPKRIVLTRLRINANKFYNETQVSCEYCRTPRVSSKEKCPSCGAPLAVCD